MDEGDQSPTDAAIRETLEEAGYEVELALDKDLHLDGPAQPIGSFTDEKGAMGFVFAGKIVGGDGVPSEGKIREVGWFDQDQIRELMVQGRLRRPEVNAPMLLDDLSTEEQEQIAALQAERGIDFNKRKPF